MKKYTKYAVAFATVVALGGSATFAMAATSDKTTTTTVQGDQQNAHGKGKGHGGFERQEFTQNTELQTLLKLTADELTTQLKAGKTLADIAAAQSVDKQAVIDLLVKQDATRLDQDVKDGKLTADQATQMKADSVQRATDCVAGKGGFPGGPGGGEHGGRGGHGGHGFEPFDQATADFLKVTLDELKTELQSGKSLLDVATAHSVTQEQLTTFLVDKQTKQLDQDLQDQKITQAQHDEMKTHIADMVDHMIAGKPAKGDRGPRGPKPGQAPGQPQHQTQTPQ